MIGKYRNTIEQPMNFNIYGNNENPSLLLLPGLGVSYEIFLPLIDLLKDKFYIIAAGIDGFLLGVESSFTSVDDQAVQMGDPGLAPDLSPAPYL